MYVRFPGICIYIVYCNNLRARYLSSDLDLVDATDLLEIGSNLFCNIKVTTMFHEFEMK